MCGERQLLGPAAGRRDGSSPRVRGTLDAEGPRGEKRRFIPACAGNAAYPGTERQQQPVHPRVCGERAVQIRHAASHAGSSPRVRGTRTPSPNSVTEVRFIPACAGNAAMGDIRPSAGSVHPRVCGERMQRVVNMTTQEGSSPRVRGTRF